MQRLGEVTLPHSKYASPTYYAIATAEASSNLSRFDGIRFGHRAEGAKNLDEIYLQSRAEGFGTEVKKRILYGTYALSADHHEELVRESDESPYAYCTRLCIRIR